MVMQLCFPLVCRCPPSSSVYLNRPWGLLGERWVILYRPNHMVRLTSGVTDAVKRRLYTRESGHTRFLRQSRLRIVHNWGYTGVLSTSPQLNTPNDSGTCISLLQKNPGGARGGCSTESR